MLKIYTCTETLYNISTGFKIYSSSYSTILDENKAVEKNEILSWDDVYTNESCSVYTGRTLIRRRPYFQGSIVTNYGRQYKSDAKYKLQKTYSESDLPITAILNRFPAKKVIQYLKEQGLAVTIGK